MGQGIQCPSCTKETGVILTPEPTLEQQPDTTYASSRKLKANTPPTTFQIEVEKKPGEEVGLEVDYHDGETLQVIRVKETGVFAKWNDENPEKRIAEGDSIIEVNGATGTSKAILAQIVDVVTNNGAMKVTVKRSA
mmetsp:Transcript_110116/g.190978  ORF Transcript_110116/g.190978 Transcript_110116/m.190978 type:complete len:136 (-) Transcript_110116:170-577(-)